MFMTTVGTGRTTAAAVGFRVSDGSDLSLDSITFGMRALSSDVDIVVSIVADDQGPDESRILESFMFSGLSTSSGAIVLDAHSALAPVLEAGSLYWLTMTLANQNRSAFWFLGPSDVLVPPPVLRSEKINGEWVISSDPDEQARSQLAVRITGTEVQPVPEPATITFWASFSALGLGLAYRRRESSRALSLPVSRQPPPPLPLTGCRRDL